MDRPTRRWLALVRALLVALGLSLLGAEPLAAVTTVTEVSAPDAHAHGLELPDPDPIVAHEREEPPGSPEDDDPGHGPGDDLVVLGPDARRVQMIRGPPATPRARTWRPRSSRGPPTLV